LVEPLVLDAEASERGKHDVGVVGGEQSLDVAFACNRATGDVSLGSNA
jgi:hypothetical protein